MGKIKRIIEIARQKFYFSEFKIKVGRCYRIKGMPLIKGEKNSITIGDCFTANSDLTSNPIGYPDPLTFWTLYGGKIIIGNNVGISNSTLVAYSSNIEIGDNVLIGGGVKIYTSDFHSISYNNRIKNTETGIRNKDVSIKNGAFIGSGSIILKGVTIGERAVIGAGSVVTKDVPADEIWAGNPARFIKKIAQ